MALLRARVDGENVASLSELARAMPIVLLDTDSLGLVTGPPEGRRKLLDGTLFHVERTFLPMWRRYAQAMRQRNGGLRRGILDADSAWRQSWLKRVSASVKVGRKSQTRCLGSLRTWRQSYLLI